jgi:diguanylate cyclase (GGDEF)-like protein
MSSPKPRILVVDDVPADLQSLARLLEDDFEVLTAASGPEAIRLAETEEVELVLLDAQMPGMDGFETCARLRGGEGTAALPVILVGTPEEEIMEAKGLGQGAVDFLPRPVRGSIARARLKVHLENRRFREVLQRLTWLDAVTGIPNEERFQEALDSEWRRNARNHTPLALLLMEPDYFDPFCETHGKPAGDEALRRLVESVTEGIQRAGDVFGRYGETRFACLLPETDTVGAVSVGEKIRAELNALAIPHEGSPIAPTLTLSLGLASLVPGRTDLLEEFKKDAEGALLRAQQRGGNQVVFG